MTEREWLACEEPAQMLRLLNGSEGEQGRSGMEAEPPGPPRFPVSKRKLRLWCGAMYAHSTYRYNVAGHVASWQRGEVWNEEEANHLMACCRAWCDPREDGEGDPPMAQRAALLRDIIGNPFRPLRVSRECKVCDGRGKLTYQIIAVYCKACLGNGREPWVTPTVLALAEAAYAEAGRRCEACKGRGGCCELKNAEDDRWRKAHTCPDCHGSGRIDDGTLAPHRLAVLADAMEEAGCADEAILRHLRGWEMCPCELERVYGIPMPRPKAGAQMLTCMRCDDGWIKKRAPCVRGCHVVDAILGRS